MMTKQAYVLLLLLLVRPIRAAEPQPVPEEAGKPPEHWAKTLEKPGLPNLHKVDDKLYRGGQPDAEGVKQLKTMGVRTVVCLRERRHAPKIGGLVEGQGLKFVRIGSDARRWKHPPTLRFLKLMLDNDNAPVYLHCRRGTDRTGVLCAAYRVVIQGWAKEQALDEMQKLTTGKYAFGGHFKNLLKYINDLDVDTVRKEIGFTPKPAAKKLPEE